ncbi:mitochondrial carrier domain-containing protein [Halteromyces radiatus]|uniref:mitochondrial carrier domain-containing protein n=1 Tax=Halteromyces radiatus TaxID=101107 RepID=UPI0022201F3D|nr:mitochondrial carrier domain-containing protein [Halteromyces radiatus]KAI8093736.1 mitochondrial carrier domain-containing protein [Halteromyces radiatus]
MLQDNAKTWSIEQLFTCLDHNKDGLIEAIDLIAVCKKSNTPLKEALLTQLKQHTQLQSKNIQISYAEFARLFDHPLVSVEEIDTMRIIAQAITPSQPWYQFMLTDTMKHLIAGGMAGAVSRTVVNPMERMKILFQIQGPDMPSYQGIWPTLKKMWQEEGMVGMMRGNGTNVLRIIPYSASQFAAYEYFKNLLMDKNETELDTPRRLVSGALAGIVSVICTYPLDMVKTRLAIQSASLRMNNNHNTHTSISTSTVHSTSVTQKLPGIFPTMMSIYRHEGGLPGLYRGLVPTTLGVSPYVAISFWSYESLKSYIDNETPTKRLVCGALAGSIAQTITYPLDVLRRRFQVVGMSNAGYKYDGTIHAIRTMIQREGVRSLYKGLIPNYLKVAPAIGVSFVTYEGCKDLLNAL